MDAELWAIVGVVVGAAATGTMGLVQAILQRRWSISDADRAWDREKRDRLFEAKRSAHAAFTDALHRGRGLVRAVRRTGASAEDRSGLLGVADELMHLQAQLQIYASPEATAAAAYAYEALIDWANAPRRPNSGLLLEQVETFQTARVAYLEMLRIDLGIEDSEINVDVLRAGIVEAELTNVGPEQGS